MIMITASLFLISLSKRLKFHLFARNYWKPNSESHFFAHAHPHSCYILTHSLGLTHLPECSTYQQKVICFRFDDFLCVCFFSSLKFIDLLLIQSNWTQEETKKKMRDNNSYSHTIDSNKQHTNPNEWIKRKRRKKHEFFIAIFLVIKRRWRHIHSSGLVFV